MKWTNMPLIGIGTWKYLPLALVGYLKLVEATNQKER